MRSFIGSTLFISSFLVLLSSFSLFANSSLKNPEEILGKESYEAITSRDKIISLGKVTSNPKQKTQSLDYLVSGLHPKSCRFALRKLSLYENYNNYLSFIKSSSYDESRHQIHFLIDHTLLPIKMTLEFSIGRITKTGDYPFSFDKGMLKGLTGVVRIRKVNNRCLFVTTAQWTGPDTGFADLILEIAASTISKIGLERLFRISSTY